jgi:hypothetical protein
VPVDPVPVDPVPVDPVPVDPGRVSAEYHKLRFNDRITAGVPAGSNEPGEYLFDLRETLLHFHTILHGLDLRGERPVDDELVWIGSSGAVLPTERIREAQRNLPVEVTTDFWIILHTGEGFVVFQERVREPRSRRNRYPKFARG